MPSRLLAAVVLLLLLLPPVVAHAYTRYRYGSGSSSSLNSGSDLQSWLNRAYNHAYHDSGQYWVVRYWDGEGNLTWQNGSWGSPVSIGQTIGGRAPQCFIDAHDFSTNWGAWNCDTTTP